MVQWFFSSNCSPMDNHVNCFKAGLNVSMCVYKRIFRFHSKMWCVGSGRRVIYDCMLYDLMKGRGYRGLKDAQLDDLKCSFLHQYSCNQMTNGELRYSKTVSKFFRSYVWYSSLFSITWPSRSPLAVLYRTCNFVYVFIVFYVLFFIVFVLCCKI